MLLHPVGAKGRMKIAAIVVLQLQLLAPLVLVQRNQHVTQLVLRGIDVDVGIRLELPIRGNALQKPRLRKIPFHRQRDTAVGQFLAFARPE